MAFDLFRHLAPLDIRVRKLRPHEDVVRGDPHIAGDWVIAYSSPRASIQVSRTRLGMIEEIEAAGFEYAPRKRVYRRGGSFVARKG